MRNLAGVMTDEVVRRIVEFLRRSSTASTRQTGEHVDPNVQAQMFNVLQCIEYNLQQLEARETSSAVRGRAQSLIAEGMNVDHMDLHRRQSGKALDQHPDPGMPHTEEVFDSLPRRDKSRSPRRKPSFTGVKITRGGQKPSEAGAKERERSPRRRPSFTGVRMIKPKPPGTELVWWCATVGN